MRLLTGLRLLASMILCLVLIPVETAMAHAQLLSSDPAENAVVEIAPEEIALIFNEPVSPLTIRLVQPDGSSLELTAAAVGGATTVIAMPADLLKGTHVLSWRVVSADGHPIGGSLVFTIGEITGAASAVAASSDGAVTASLWASKALLFIALFVGVGGAAFSAVAPLPPQGRLLSLALAATGIVIAPVTLILQGLDGLGLALGSALQAGAWATGLSTSYGATVIAVTVAFLMAVISLVPQRRRSTALIGIGAAAIGALSLCLSGHASTAAPQWVTRPAVFLHISGILFWVGALVPLWFLLRQRTVAGDRALAAFSNGIPFAVAPLVLSGITLAAIQMGAPGPQWVTPYGLILAAKLSLLSMLFGLAVWNRRWLTVPALAGEVTARRHLRRSIGWELTIIIVVLSLVAGWRFTPPPRAIADLPAVVAADPMVFHLIDGNTLAMVTMTPGSAGPVDLDILIADLEHVPRDAQAVAVSIANAKLGIEPIRNEASEIDGMWRVEDLVIPVSGNWEMEVEVRIGRFGLVRPRGEVAVP